MLRGALTVIRLGPALILAGLVAAMTLLSPVFLTTGNVGNILSQTAAIALLAIGQLLVIITTRHRSLGRLDARARIGARRPRLS